MQIFVYEFITGGGLLRSGECESKLTSLRDEGLAMFKAIATDLAQVQDVEVLGLWDARLESPPSDFPVTLSSVSNRSDHQRAFDRLAATSDATLIIAPETDEELYLAAKRVLEVGGQLLGPDPELIALASNKHALVQHLSQHGVSVPEGRVLHVGDSLPQAFNYPAVLKPLDGVGALEMFLVADEAQASSLRPGFDCRLEAYCPGVPASVAFLCGPSGNEILPSCRQDVRIEQNAFHYHGGAVPLPNAMATRAMRLARGTVESLPSPRGYLGVDLILGEDPAGKQDFVLEINPRLTTSYVGLRQALKVNLAKLMLDVFDGYPVKLCVEPRAVEFSADGRVWASVESGSIESIHRASMS